VPHILLFNPPDPGSHKHTREGRCTQVAGFWATQWPPVSLATTAAFLEIDGHMVRVVDFPAVNRNTTDLLRLIEIERPDIAVWSTGTPTLESDLSLARKIKHTAPATITAVLGTHVSVQPQRVLETSSVDAVIRREPEQTIRELCRKVNGDRHAIDGVSYREAGTAKIRHNPDREFLSPNEIPPPAWHLLDLRPYRLPLRGHNFLIVAPIRGCSYPCNFCTAAIYYGKKPRLRPVSLVVDEIEANIAQHRVHDYFVWADTFTIDRQYVSRFCQTLISRGLNISWACNSRVDTVDRDLLALMRKSGLWMISFGIESGNQAILDQTGKNITVQQSRTAVQTAHALGIKTSGHFILGLAGETQTTMQDTLQLALELPLDIAQFYAAAPFPGTGLHAQAIEKRWLTGEGSVSQSRAAMHLPGLSAREVDRFRKQAYRKFYLRAILPAG
jgi:radical SAM superfamily enzyme YgiQ (UPF0313 family)